MAINQNESGRGGAGSNGSDINEIVNRLGGPRVVVVLAVVVIIAIRVSPSGAYRRSLSK